MPDRIDFVFSMMWEQPGVSGELVDYAHQVVFSDPDELMPMTDRVRQVTRAHGQACEGHWVKQGMKRPHVSALRLVKDGRLLAEETRPAVDLPEFADAEPRHGVDPRTKEPARA